MDPTKYNALLPARVAPPPPERAAAAPYLSARAAVATGLCVLGCAAAALALFAMALNPAEYRFLGPCAPTDEEAAELHAAAKLLLVASARLVLAATVALLVPKRWLTVFAGSMGFAPTYAAIDVLWKLVACHNHVDGELAVHFWFFGAMLLAALLACQYAV